MIKKIFSIPFIFFFLFVPILGQQGYTSFRFFFPFFLGSLFRKVNRSYLPLNCRAYKRRSQTRASFQGVHLYEAATEAPMELRRRQLRLLVRSDLVVEASTAVSDARFSFQWWPSKGHSLRNSKNWIMIWTNQRCRWYELVLWMKRIRHQQGAQAIAIVIKFQGLRT